MPQRAVPHARRERTRGITLRFAGGGSNSGKTPLKEKDIKRSEE